MPSSGNILSIAYRHDADTAIHHHFVLMKKAQIEEGNLNNLRDTLSYLSKLHKEIGPYLLQTEDTKRLSGQQHL